MNFLYTCILCCTVFVVIQAYFTEPTPSTCEYVGGYSNHISYISHDRRIQNYDKCWIIQPPSDSIVRIKFSQLDLNDPYCEDAYIQITESQNTGRQEKICQRYNFPDWRNKTLTMVGAVNITLIMKHTWDYVSFYMEYYAESITCISKDNFRCSSYKCIPAEQVCNGVEDCENGLDESECGIAAFNGTKESRTIGVNWLLNHQKNYGWGRNTHRAVTSLYLTNAAKFRGKVDEEVIVKQLQLKIASSLLRNQTEPISVNELSMYVNALLVTCHNVRNIFSEDLLKILADRAFSTSPASSGAYLALCNADWDFSEENVQELMHLLTKDIEYPFALEIRAMASMALTCLNEKYTFIHNMKNISSIYNETIKNFIVNQNQDGSFGNAHTTAMVTQALLASGQAENSQWNINGALQFLMKNLNSSSIDFLSVYLTLPLLQGKTLVDIGNVQCGNYRRKLEDDEDILDITDKTGVKMHVQYSLYIGKSKNVIHNIYVKVPENSTVYDVMKVAQLADPKYKFSYHKRGGHVYIYGLADLTNDMEAGNYWLFYIASGNNTELVQFIQSPDQIILKDKEHLIMWYTSANI